MSKVGQYSCPIRSINTGRNEIFIANFYPSFLNPSTLQQILSYNLIHANSNSVHSRQSGHTNAHARTHTEIFLYTFTLRESFNSKYIPTYVKNKFYNAHQKVFNYTSVMFGLVTRRN